MVSSHLLLLIHVGHVSIGASHTLVEATSRGKPAPPAIAAPPGHTYATLET